MHTFRKKVTSRLAFYSAYVDVINGLLRLSKKECEVFSLMLFATEKLDTNNIITYGVRAVVRSEMGITSQHLAKLVKGLKDKSVLLKNSRGDWYINKVLVPVIHDDKCTITYIISLVEGVGDE